MREEFLDLLRTDGAFREDVRRQILTEDLLALRGRFDQLTELVRQSISLLRETVRVVRLLAEAQQRREERVGRVQGRLDEIESVLQRLAEAQIRTEERVERLEVSMEHFGTRMEAVEAALQRLTEAQLRTEEELRWLANWQRGESWRREGERYEPETLRRALALFNGGQGGAPDQPWVHRRLIEQLGSLVAWGLLEPEEDPFLADLFWWRGSSSPW